MLHDELYRSAFGIACEALEHVLLGVHHEVAHVPVLMEGAKASVPHPTLAQLDEVAHHVVDLRGFLDSLDGVVVDSCHDVQIKTLCKVNLARVRAWPVCRLPSTPLSIYAIYRLGGVGATV